MFSEKFNELNNAYVEKVTIDESEQYDDGIELIDVLIIDK